MIRNMVIIKRLGLVRTNADTVKTVQNEQYAAPDFEHIAYEQNEDIAVEFESDIINNDRDAVIVW